VVATLITPAPSPVKTAGDDADVAAALAAAVTAASAAAAAAAAAAAEAAKPQQDSGSARGRRSGDGSLLRDDVIRAIEVDADAPSPKARSSRRKANSASPSSKATSPAAGVGSKRRNRERSEDGDKEQVFIFVKKDLLPEVGRAHAAALDLQRGLSSVVKTQRIKFVNAGAEVEPILAYQLDFDRLLSENATYLAFGKALAEGARWAVPEHDVTVMNSGNARMAAFTREINRKQWLAAAEILDSGTELPSAQLTQLQSCVTAFFVERADDMRRTLKGGSDIAKEVCAAGKRQAEQVRLLWPSLGSRISIAALAAAKSGQSGIAAVGEHTNSAWTRVLAPFMREHILQVTQEDAADFMGKPDTAVRAKLQFGNASAGGGVGPA
jgi:hypothetical protein